jgi:hypothetical protein
MSWNWLRSSVFHARSVRARNAARSFAFTAGSEHARHAGVREKIGTVWGDFEFYQRIGIEESFDRHSDWSIFREDEQTVLAFGKADFFSGGEHAFGFDSAHFRFTDGEGAEVGTGKTAWNFVSNFVVFSAADDLTKLTFTGIDLRDLEFVSIWMLNGFLNLGDDDFIRGDSFGDDALDFDASKGEEIGDLIDGFSGKIEVG